MLLLVKGYMLFWICCLWGCVEFLAAAQDFPSVDVQDEFDLPKRAAGPGSGDGGQGASDEHSV